MLSIMRRSVIVSNGRPSRSFVKTVQRFLRLGVIGAGICISNSFEIIMGKTV